GARSTDAAGRAPPRPRLLAAAAGGPRRRAGPLEEFLELLEELALALGADEALLRLAVEEEDERGDGHDLEPPRHERVVVHVELPYPQLARVFVGNFFQDRGDELARPAPLGPEIDEDRFGRRLDLLVERGVTQRRDVVHAPLLLGSLR